MVTSASGVAVSHLLSIGLPPPQPRITVSPANPPASTAHPDALAAVLRGQECEHEGGSFAEAEALYRRALKIDPDYRRAKFYLGQLYLAEGDYARAWPLLEHRYVPGHQGAGPPRWKGENLRGKTIAVTLEAGLGDQLQFARFVPLLRSRGGRVVLMCPAELARIYKSLAGVDQVYPVGSIPGGVNVNIEVTLRPDYYIDLCSLPHIFNLDSHAVPQPPYLHADPADVECWRPRLPPCGLRVGLVWRGGVHNAYDPWRSLPSLSALAPLWQVPGVTFVSLQKGAGEDEARSSPLPLVHIGSEVNDFADTAAILAQVDVLISVDTSTAHLAAALGKPLWVLLDRVPDWRWRPESMRRWFPSARAFYQHRSGEWGGVIEDVVAALRELVNAR